MILFFFFSDLTYDLRLQIPIFFMLLLILLSFTVYISFDLAGIQIKSAVGENYTQNIMSTRRLIIRSIQKYRCKTLIQNRTSVNCYQSNFKIFTKRALYKVQLVNVG